jgi:hypothetical protein
MFNFDKQNSLFNKLLDYRNSVSFCNGPKTSEASKAGLARQSAKYAKLVIFLLVLKMKWTQ